MTKREAKHLAVNVIISALALYDAEPYPDPDLEHLTDAGRRKVMRHVGEITWTLIDRYQKKKPADPAAGE